MVLVVGFIKEVYRKMNPELARMIDSLPQDSYNKVECLVKQLLVSSDQEKKEKAFKIFMHKMAAAEKSVQEHGYYSEEEVEEELAKI